MLDDLFHLLDTGEPRRIKEECIFNVLPLQPLTLKSQVDLFAYLLNFLELNDCDKLLLLRFQRLHLLEQLGRSERLAICYFHLLYFRLAGFAQFRLLLLLDWLGADRLSL